MTEAQARTLIRLIATLLLGAAAFGFADQMGKPRLVGYGCENASGPLYADEEDYFPVCETIEAN